MAEADGGRIELTPLGVPLRSDVPGSVRDAVLFLVGEWFWRAWGGLLYSVRTGEPAFDRIYGMSNFDYWEHEPEAGAIARRRYPRTSEADAVDRLVVAEPAHAKMEDRWPRATDDLLV